MEFLLGLVPILLFLLMLAVFKLSPKISAYSSLLVAVILTFFVSNWKMGFGGIVGSILEGFSIAIWPIGAIVIAAIFCYELSVKTGEIEVIKKMMSNVSSDKRIQALLIAWGFGGFMEGVAGYGTAVAIPAAILVSLGFQPLLAAVICLVANTVPTAFGSVGVPVTVLADQTGVDVRILSYNVNLQLMPLMFIIPIIIFLLASTEIEKSKRKNIFKDGMIFVLIASIIGYLPEIIIGKLFGAELPTIIGSILTMILIIIATKLFIKKDSSDEVHEISFKEAIKAWLPYILMVIFIISVSPVFKSVDQWLGARTVSTIDFTFGHPDWFNVEDYHGAKFKWILAPIVPILLATVIAGFIQGASTKLMTETFKETLKGKMPSVIVIMGIVALASVMKYSGMIKSIADGLVTLTGSYYPLISPLLGTLGTFVTGSDTSSNLLFGVLQRDVAVGLDPNNESLKAWLSAANTAGATGGKMISPQNIAIAASTVGLIGKEGEMLSKTMKYCLLYVAILGIVVYVGQIS